MKELDEMEKINAKLSAAVEDVTLEHCKKNEVSLKNDQNFSILSFQMLENWTTTVGGGCEMQIVKHHSQEMAVQRRVFVDFFCNPERLRNQVKELTARVRALQAS